MKSTPRSVASITSDLGRLGVRTGDLLMVHASVRAIGPVQGGANGVVDALEAAVGRGGTLFVNIGVDDPHGWVNERPEPERAELLRNAEPFDHLVTPSDPDNGVLAELFRTRPGTVVSNHPEGRFAASGPLAKDLLENVPWNHYYGHGSPLERFTHAGGRVLRLGADIDTVTLIHYAEYLVSLPSKRQVRRHRLVTGPHGPEIRVVECLDDSGGIVDYPGEDYFGLILGDYLRTGRAATGTVGQASSELFDGADLVSFATEWMTSRFRDL